MPEFQTPRLVVALRDKDDSSLERSASGGAFPVLARPVLAAGGAVCGAYMRDDGTVAHCVVRSQSDLALLQGSAYVQSDLSPAFTDVMNLVSSGVRTLFVGTPCQCSSMVAFLETKGVLRNPADYESLIVCDLVCHGVPSPMLYDAYRKWLDHKTGADGGVHGYRFRSKRNGWGLYYYYYYYYKDGRRREVCSPGDSDPYYGAFLRGESYRPSCYRCPYARAERTTDFTIGDYWGIESVDPKFFDSRGVSLLLANTEKGERFFRDEASGGCEFVETDLSSAVRENHNLKAPTAVPAGRQAFLSHMEQCIKAGDLSPMFDRYLKPPMSLKRIVKDLLPGDAYLSLKKLVKGGGR
ncbi:Coenzyme F420 hydrogenase/dehydrogenase, beta subunit C-terminal domain [Caniella muris]|uniref:Coenzyme F420 hydrogenase/dehydrogenase, beta subunit C-terminal domain n=1 Tax=Caniella muris TaxID=2941502 RepID=UPI0020425594|nr:Coenzyme F420 hydrogenase/dehydrogenase, beta subunit C-terminal domain [Caniella muris]